MQKHTLALLLLLLLMVPGSRALPFDSLAGLPEDPARENSYRRYQLQRIDLYLLDALQQENIDLWLVVTRENNPDTLAKDLFAHTAVLPATLLFEVRDGKLRQLRHHSLPTERRLRRGHPLWP